MDYNSYDNHRGYSYMPQVEKVIKPNMEESAKKLQLYSVLSLVGIAVCFIGFAIAGISSVSSLRGFSPVIIIPFFGFGGFGFLSAILLPRAKMAQAIVSVINQIKNSDKIEISDISYIFKNFKGDVLYIIRLLISTGNLQGYRIIDDHIVAKEGEFIPPAERDNAKLYICDECGTELRKGDIFCPKCGKRK